MAMIQQTVLFHKYQFFSQQVSLIKVNDNSIRIQYKGKYKGNSGLSLSKFISMIEAKQTVTKDSLLSFKKDHGQFYQKFVNVLKNRVDYCRHVRSHSSCPSYMIAEKCIFMTILQRKHKKFFDEQLQLQQLAATLQKYRTAIQKSVTAQKHCVLKLKKIKIQTLEQNVLEIVTRQHFSFNSFDLEENTYIYELIKAITGKSEQVNFLGQQKYAPMCYSSNNIEQICKVLGEKILFFDYNASKQPPQFQFNPQTTYILRVKERYLILYVKQPKEIQIIEEGTISLSELEKIYAPEQKEKGFLDKLIRPEEKITSRLFPDEVQCSICVAILSQFDCLKWNYEYYCSLCLQNPSLDTSHIPETLVEKFFREKGIKHDNYQIQCVQCTAFTTLRKYNPAKKPKKYRCEVCQSTICLQHNENIYLCFCECQNCHVPTINIMHLNMVVCQKCKKRFCRKCKTASDKSCNCICKMCLQENEEGHVCRQRCHFCSNHINRMKTCTCGSKICYGCFYYKLQHNMKDGYFKCSGPTSFE